MICPECETLNDDNAEFCINCGAKLEKGNIKNKEEKKKGTNNLLKIILVTVAVLLVAVIVLIIYLSGKNIKGFKTAEKLSQTIGQDIIATAKITPLEEKSVSEALNNIAAADYYYESGKLIKVDGVNVPEWSVGVYLVQTKINKVTYRDYTVQDKNYKGEKCDNYISFDKINSSMTVDDVNQYMGISPSMITWYINSKEYTYRYYYIDDSNNEKAYIITVKFDADNNYVSKQMEDLSINPSIK